jgi:hypothetical protein
MYRKHKGINDAISDISQKENPRKQPISPPSFDIFMEECKQLLFISFVTDSQTDT